MSDHTVALTVVLDSEYRIEDAESIISAILMIKGVASVDAFVTSPDSHIAYTRARLDLERRIFDVLKSR
jgi:hypothetical protein